MNDPLLRFRDRFPILRSTKYLVSHSLGAMPDTARDALNEYAEVWATRGVRAWEETWWMMSIEIGDILAPIVGAPHGSIVMLPNVTTAQAVVLSAFEYEPPRNRIVMLEADFPSVRYVYDRLARRLGAEVVWVGGGAKTEASNTVCGGAPFAFDLDALLDSIDERTQLVAISHVLFESSYLVDAAAVARRCREVGATLVLDVFQSAGIVPVKLREWGVPIATGGVLKWLCGGPGGGYLYVDPDLRSSLEPSLTGWMAHASPFSFEAPPMRFRDDALRFALGTPAVPALYAAREGPKIVAEAGADGMASIRGKSLRQTERLIAHADARGFAVYTPRQSGLRGGTICIHVPEAREVAAVLNAENILCDYRPASGIRLAPHFYTTDEDIDAAFAAIDDVHARLRA